MHRPHTLKHIFTTESKYTCLCGVIDYYERRSLQQHRDGFLIRTKQNANRTRLTRSINHAHIV